jgi:integrase
MSTKTKSNRKNDYNIDMDTQSKFHLLKKTRKNGRTLVMAILDESGHGYSKMVALSTMNQATARKRAQEILKQAELDAKKLSAEKDNLKNFLEGFWKDNSEYVLSRKDEGYSLTARYIAANAALLKNHFMSWAEKNGVERLSQLTKIGLLSWRNWLSAEVQKKGYSVSIVNSARMALYVPLKFAEEMDILETNPLSAIHKVKTHPKERQPFSRDELKKLFAAKWPDERVRVAAMLSFFSGARIGEIKGLLWENVHENSIDIVLQFVESKLSYGLAKPKCNSTRLGVPVPKEILESMQKLRKASKHPFGKFVFQSDYLNEPILNYALSQGLTAGLLAAGIEQAGRSWHNLRHSFATLMRGKVGLEVTSKSIGHSSMSVTAGYANHETEEDKTALRNAVIGLLA